MGYPAVKAPSGKLLLFLPHPTGSAFPEIHRQPQTPILFPRVTVSITVLIAVFPCLPAVGPNSEIATRNTRLLRTKRLPPQDGMNLIFQNLYDPKERV